MEVDTDDQRDPSCKHVPKDIQSSTARLTNGDALDGVVVFLILSVAEEVCAIICASLPVVIPQFVRGYRSKRSSQETENSYPKRLVAMPQPRSTVGGFQKLSEGLGDRGCEARNLSGGQDWGSGSILLNHVVVESCRRNQDLGDAQIGVEREYEVTVTARG